MNWLDIILVIILLSSIAGGFVKGFARVGIGFAAAVLGVILGLWFHGIPAGFVMPHLTSRMASNVIGFFVVFFLVVLAGALCSRLLAMMFKWTGLTWLDRLLGAGFGVLRGVVISVALVMALMAFSVNPPPKAVVESRVTPYVIDAARVLVSIAPRELKIAFEKSYERVKKVWGEAPGQNVRRLPATEI